MTAGRRQRTVCSQWRRLLPAVVLVLVLAVAPLPAARSSQPQQKPPENLSSAEFTRLIREVSEEGGYFFSDNLISNETPYLTVVDKDHAPMTPHLGQYFFFCGEAHRLEASGPAERPWLRASVVARLVLYDWPGNVRQLRNVLDSAVVLAEENTIKPSDLALRDSGSSDLETLRIDEWERRLIVEALTRTGDNVPEAATLLGIGRATLYRKIDRYGLKR